MGEFVNLLESDQIINSISSITLDCSMKVYRAVLIMLLFALSCSEDSDPPPPADSCENLINNFESALTVYNSDPTNKNKCVYVKDAGTLLLDCDGLTAAQKTEYQNTLNGITCN